MQTLTVKIGGIIPGDYPPRMVLADCWNGEATILRADREDDDIDSMIRQAVHVQRMRRAKNARIDKSKRL